MQERSKIAAFICIGITVLLSFFAVLLYTPTVINGLEAQKNADGGTGTQTDAVWVQNTAAHHLALLQSHCGSRDYQCACLEHLAVGYYSPASAWAEDHPALGEEVHRRYAELYREREENLQAIDEEYSSDTHTLSVSATYGFAAPPLQTNTDIWFREPAMEYAAFQFVHTSKADAKETFSAFVETADDHYNCTEFLQFIVYSDSADKSDIVWVKEQAARLIPIIEAESASYRDNSRALSAKYTTLQTLANWQE